MARRRARASATAAGPLRSWVWTLAAGLVLAAAFAALALASSRIGLPGRPRPTASSYRNPFSANPADLVDAGEAARVKSDLLADGRIELLAFQQGDAAALARSRTGAALDRVRQLVEANNAAGIAEREDIHLDSVTVGRLTDPANPRLTSWCAEERGSGTITYFARATGATQRVSSEHFDIRFWMLRVDGRYLIADTAVLASGS